VYYDKNNPDLVTSDPNHTVFSFPAVFFIIFGVIWLIITISCAVIGLREVFDRSSFKRSEIDYDAAADEYIRKNIEKKEYISEQPASREFINRD
jgi:hypothetical protein